MALFEVISHVQLTEQQIGAIGARGPYQTLDDLIDAIAHELQSSPACAPDRAALNQVAQKLIDARCVRIGFANETPWQIAGRMLTADLPDSMLRVLARNGTYPSIAALAADIRLMVRTMTGTETGLSAGFGPAQKLATSGLVRVVGFHGQSETDPQIPDDIHREHPSL